jgi:hypothetical protein
MVRAKFPATTYLALAGELTDHDGLLHLQVGALARLAQSAKGTADWDTYGRVMSLADTLWRNPSKDLLNALNVSFLEHLDFDGPRGSAAWALLSPALQRGWRDMQAYLKALGRGGRDASRRMTH